MKQVFLLALLVCSTCFAQQNEPLFYGSDGTLFTGSSVAAPVDPTPCNTLPVSNFSGYANDYSLMGPGNYIDNSLYYVELGNTAMPNPNVGVYLQLNNTRDYLREAEIYSKRNEDKSIRAQRF